MIPKILTGVALAFAVIGLIIKLVAISVPHFVDVHLIADIDDLDDDNLIASVGVYQSIYDPTGDNIRATVEAEGLPGDVIESGTTDFVLLFPSQLNFQSQLVPVGQAEAAQLDATLNSGTLAQDTIAPGIAAIEDVEFENCGQYFQAGLQGSIGYFNVLEDAFLPTAVSAITAEIAAGLNFGTDGTDGLTGLEAGIFLAASAPADIMAVLLTQIFSVGDAVSILACSNFFVNGEVDFDALMSDIRGCIQGAGPLVAGGLGAQPVTLQLFTYMTDFLENDILFPDGANFSDAFEAIQGSVFFDQADGTGGGSLAVAPIFAANLGVNLCTDVFDSCVTKLDYLQDLIDLYNENVGANAALQDAIDAVEAYLGLFLAGFIQVTDTFLDNFEALPSAVAQTTFPALFTGAYQPCDLLNLFNLLVPEAGLFNETESCVSFIDFLPAVEQVLIFVQNELAGLVGEVVEVYLACAALGPGAIDGFCAEFIFGPGLLAATLDVDPAENFEARFVEECELDEEDREAVATAQILAGVSTALNILTVIAIIVSFFVLPQIVAPIGAVIAILAGVFIIAALLVVQAAPVYDGVGEEPSGELEPTFVAGYVGLLALVDAVLSFFAGILLIAAAVSTCFCNDSCGEVDEGDNEKKDVVNMEDNL